MTQLTGYATRYRVGRRKIADREKCVEAGMDGYLTKPIKSAELDAVLQIYATQNRHPVA
jgi:CheY-like chemotaxis protein